MAGGKHTPGEWRPCNTDHTRIVTVAELVAAVNSRRRLVIPGQAEADALLIAAAPALLAVCQNVLRCAALPDEWAAPIRAAISKATAA